MTVKTEPVKAEPVKTEPVKTEPVKAEPVKAEPVKTEPVKTEPAKVEAFAMADLAATMQAMGKQMDDLRAAVTAIANQGSVNGSIHQDNHETNEEEYPTIDIDGINRLLGV